MLFCRGCNSSFPCSMIINGKTAILNRRKFCLKCSPYKEHNTKKDGPKSKIEQKEKRRLLKKKQLRYTGKSILQGIARKEELIRLAGSACKKCGYTSKYLRPFSFHHRNSRSKKFGLSVENLRNKKWSLILAEFKKCDLVCLTCHAEIEEEILLKKTKCSTKTKWSEILIKFGKPKDFKYRRTRTKKCKFCRSRFKTKDKLRKYCSIICSGKFSRWKFGVMK